MLLKSEEGTLAKKPTHLVVPPPRCCVTNSRGYCCHILCARWHLLLRYLS